MAYAALIARAWHAAGEWPRLYPYSFWEGWTANVYASEFPLHLTWLDALGSGVLASSFFFVPLHAAIRVHTLRSRALLALFALPCALVLWVVCTEGPCNAMNWISYSS